MFGTWKRDAALFGGALLAVSAVMTVTGAAVAEETSPMAPAEALKVLVEAREVNARCGFLPAATDELAGYAARAEIATAASQGVEAATGAVDAGRHAARQTDCGEDARAMVHEALAAAREAMRQARRQSPERMAPARRTADVVAATAARRANAGRRQGAARRRVMAGAGAAGRGGGDGASSLARRYVELAGTYYLDLRCRRLPYPQARALWKKVRRLHYRLLRTGGANVLLAAKEKARARAARRSCGSLRLARR